MKILMYNFVPYDDSEKRGGGVTVYLNNVINYLIKQGHEIFFLSSGMFYDLLNNQPHLKVYEENCVTHLVIYNSPFLAPSICSFDNPEIFINNHSLHGIANTIFNNFPEIDIFHFHNIEGLNSTFIENLKKKFIKSKFIFSVHNYNLLCMQVNLWFQEKENCKNYNEGERCTKCIIHPLNYENIKKVKKIQTFLRDLPIPINDNISDKIYYNSKEFYRKLMLLKANRITNNKTNTVHLTHGKKEDYVSYRESNINLCNNIFDKIIAVSNRTKSILVEYGVEEEKCEVAYIGTKFYEIFLNSKKKKDFDDYLTIGYLGYMRKDKGFDFFISAIDELDNNIKKKINIVIAAKFRDKETIEKLISMKSSFKDFNLYDGYNHQTLPNILSEIDLGVIPVQWEDNLPQVAIEFVCNGIPILTSNLGGASEIGNNSNFIFNQGSFESFSKRILNILERKIFLYDFWTEDLNIYSIESHINHLIEIYSN